MTNTERTDLLRQVHGAATASSHMTLDYSDLDALADECEQLVATNVALRAVLYEARGLVETALRAHESSGLLSAAWVEAAAKLCEWSFADFVGADGSAALDAVRQAQRVLPDVYASREAVRDALASLRAAFGDVP